MSVYFVSLLWNVGGDMHFLKQSPVFILLFLFLTSRWVTGEWQNCSKPCGKTGLQVRSVLCVQPSEDNTTSVIHSKHCSKNRPESRRICNRYPCPTQWSVDPWSRVCDLYCYLVFIQFTMPLDWFRQIRIGNSQIQYLSIPCNQWCFCEMSVYVLYH